MRKGVLKFTKEEIEIAVKNSTSYRKVLEYIGKNPKSGGQCNVIKKYITKLNIDISHFTGQGWNLNNHSGLLTARVKPLNDIFDNKISITSYNLKLKLYDQKLKNKECEICGIVDWNNKPAPLELHHIDGNRNNNNFSNLQIICPNCHAQTTTHRRRNNTKYSLSKYCKKCDKKIYARNLSGLCRTCYDIDHRKV